MSSFKSIAAVAALGDDDTGVVDVASFMDPHTMMEEVSPPLMTTSTPGKFPCTECNFEAQSARQLSRHKAVTHTQNALKCVLCPFVTAYQTNLLRHRKDVHGICGSKGNKSCKFCGFVSDDNDALIQHQIDAHQDILKSAQAKFAKELVSAGGDDTFEYDSDYLRNQDFSTAFSTKKAKKAAKLAKRKLLQQQQQQELENFNMSAQLESLLSAAAAAAAANPTTIQLNEDVDDEDDEEDEEDEGNEISDFWKSGFMDNYEGGATGAGVEAGGNQFFGQHVATFQGHHHQHHQHGSSVHESSRSSTPKSLQSSQNYRNTGGKQSSSNMANLNNMNNNSLTADGLPATRIRRQYTCNECSFRTVNPREFLYHRRDSHGHRIKIVECPYCVYACQYVQKLQRHLFLVHKLALTSELNGTDVNGENVDTAVSVAAAAAAASNANEGIGVPTKRKYKKRSHNEAFHSSENDVKHMGNHHQQHLNHSQNNHHNHHHHHQQPNDEDYGYDDDGEMEPNGEMATFEMNLNEYDTSMVDGIKSNDDEAEDKANVTLKCQLCQISFIDLTAAQKHFMKIHKSQRLLEEAIAIMMVDNSNKANLQAPSVVSAASTTSSSNAQKKPHDEALKVHVCDSCGYKTRWISELERHVRVHSKEKPFKCSFCDFKSKWKGDLNRHMQRYHPDQLSAMTELETTAANLDINLPLAAGSTGGGNPFANQMGKSADASDEEEMLDNDADPTELLATNYEYSMEVDDQTNYTATNSMADEDEQPGTILDSVQQSPASSSQQNGSSGGAGSTGSSKMFKCTHCDFMCNTASRFHVHYVQHLNTKPFQCSVCGHRSNWEWDVTKHIKMKAQRDARHINARPVLIHDSGKRDYSKYNKFLVYVDQQMLVDFAHTDATNKIDFRAKRFKNDCETENDSVIGNGGRRSSIVTRPATVCYEVDNDNFAQVGKSGVLVVKSVVASRHGASRCQTIQCGECSFKHDYARVMVAHMATHSMEKPYACKHCSFDTNWREVIITHYGQKHAQANANDYEMRFRCAIDENSVCRIISLDELNQLEAAENALSAADEFDNVSITVDGAFEQAGFDAPPAQPTVLFGINGINSIGGKSLIEPNLYEEKAVYPCEVCPFITTNEKKMKIHYRFHNPLKGTLKCKFCPYFANNKDKLVRHQKLHSQSNLASNATIELGSAPELTEGMLMQSLQEEAGGDDDYFDDGQSMDLSSAHSSVVDVNEMRSANGNGPALKKFSYVCPECPAAFKSPGDFKTHSEFHSADHKFLCAYCTYRARTRQQLVKHQYVHTEEYIAKRVNSYPDGTKHTIGSQPPSQQSVNGNNNNNNTSANNNNNNSHQTLLQSLGSNNFSNNLFANCSGQSTPAQISFALSHYLSAKNKIVPPLMKSPKSLKAALKANRKQRTKVDFPMKPVKVKLNSGENGKQRIEFNNTMLMTNQEFIETKEYLQRINSGIKNRCMYRCSKCPAVFTKVNTLIYHMTLHDQKYEFRCGSCDYSNPSQNNVNIHKLLHNLTESQTAVGYNFNYNCHKCPAGFSKRTRLEKHLSLHGSVYNWRCDKCDYSVPYAATLVKHRALHLINPNFQAIEGENKCLMEGLLPADQAEDGPSGLVNATDDAANETPGIDLEDKINNNAVVALDNLKVKLNVGKLCVPPLTAAAVVGEASGDDSSDEILDESQEDDDYDTSMLLIDEQEVDDEEEEEAVPDDDEEDDDEEQVATDRIEVKPTALLHHGIATNE